MLKKMTKMTLFSIPNTYASNPLHSSGSSLFFEVYRLGDNFKQDLLYSNREKKEEVRFRYADEGIITYNIENLELYGNIIIQFKTIGKLTTSNLFRITFNTAFLNVENKVQIKRLNISPESLHKDTSKFQADFAIVLHFEDVC